MLGAWSASARHAFVSSGLPSPVHADSSTSISATSPAIPTLTRRSYGRPPDEPVDGSYGRCPSLAPERGTDENAAGGPPRVRGRLVTAIVGFMSAFAVVLTGLRAVGASPV